MSYITAPQAVAALGRAGGLSSISGIGTNTAVFALGNNSVVFTAANDVITASPSDPGPALRYAGAITGVSGVGTATVNLTSDKGNQVQLVNIGNVFDLTGGADIAAITTPAPVYVAAASLTTTFSGANNDLKLTAYPSGPSGNRWSLTMTVGPEQRSGQGDLATLSGYDINVDMECDIDSLPLNNMSDIITAITAVVPAYGLANTPGIQVANAPGSNGNSSPTGPLAKTYLSGGH